MHMKRTPDQIQKTPVTLAGHFKVTVNHKLHEILNEYPNNAVCPDQSDIEPEDGRDKLPKAAINAARICVPAIAVNRIGAG